MKKAIKRAGREFLVAVAIEAGEKIGKSIGRRIGRAIEKRRKRKAKK